MKALLTVVLAVFLTAAAHAQQATAVNARPDCVVQFTFTAATTGTSYDNRNSGCTTWYTAYMSTGFSALSMVTQTAPDVTGVPGSWSTFTAVTGSNPTTTLTQSSQSFSGYFPWLRVNLTSVTGTGTVRGIFYGWRVPASGPSGSGSASSAATCTLSAVIALTASGNTEIIAASGTTAIRICHISIAGPNVQDVRLTQGTGTNCGTGTSNLTGLYGSITSLAFDWGTGAALTATAGNAVCVNQSGANTTGGVVIYARS